MSASAARPELISRASTRYSYGGSARSPRRTSISVHRTDSGDEAYDWLVCQVAEHALGQRGAML